jgi:hypothetical protein
MFSNDNFQFVARANLILFAKSASGATRGYKRGRNLRAVRDPKADLTATKFSGQCQIAFAALTTNFNFARSSASVTGLPATVEAKPHWGLTAS